MRALLLLLALAGPVSAAIGPNEVMEDPALHARAMDLYEALRCVRCRSESIGSSNADWATDARAVVRERLLAGDSDAEVLAFFEARYGEYVLMNPPFSAGTALLWLAGPILLLAGGGMAAVYITRRGHMGDGEPALSEDEKARLARLTKPGDPSGT